MEHGIGIGLTSGLPQRILVVQPCVNDRARSGVKPEEQSKSSMKLGAPPVGVCTTKGLALAKGRVVRIARYLFEDEIGHRAEELHLRGVNVSDWIRAPRVPRGFAYCSPAISKGSPEEQRPAVDNERGGGR